MKLQRANADIFIPDGTPLPDALSRTTHLGIGAHQDDLEFFAAHGMLECHGCDDDELRSGRRREGMFSAVKGFALKAAQGLTFGVGGYMATAAGYDPLMVDRTGLDEATAWKMKVALVGFQCAGLLLAIAIMWLYPITRQRAEETQRMLREAAH